MSEARRGLLPTSLPGEMCPHDGELPSHRAAHSHSLAPVHCVQPDLLALPRLMCPWPAEPYVQLYTVYSVYPMYSKTCWLSYTQCVLGLENLTKSNTFFCRIVLVVNSVSPCWFSFNLLHMLPCLCVHLYSVNAFPYLKYVVGIKGVKSDLREGPAIRPHLTLL